MDGIRADPNEVQLLRDWPVLKTTNELVQYLRLSFTLYTDLSRNGLGIVLYQTQYNKQRPIAFATRAFEAYPTHKLELPELKRAVRDQFNKFEVHTDNNSLIYVATTAKLDTTGHRRLPILASYDFIIRYRAGYQNTDSGANLEFPVIYIWNHQLSLLYVNHINFIYLHY